MHPGAWFLWACGAAGAAVVTINPLYLVPIIAASWLVHSAHGRPGTAGKAFRTFAMFGAVAFVLRTALVVFAPGGADASSFRYVALEGLRLATILVVFGTFNSVTDPSRVLRLAPRRWHEPALVASLAFTIAPRTLAAITRVREAQRMRGIQVKGIRRLPALAVPVLATGIEEAMTLAESMDARGHGRGTRSRYRVDPWTSASSMIAIAGLIPAFVFGGMSVVGDRSLGSGDPSWAGLATVIAIALPGVVRGARDG